MQSLITKLTSVSIFLSIIMILGCSTEPNQAAAQKHFYKANEQFTKGDYIRAIAEYGRATGKDPNLAEAYLMRGLARTKLNNRRVIPVAAGKLGYAVIGAQDFSKAIKANPNYVEAYYQLGFSFELGKYYDKAISHYKKAISIILNGGGSVERLAELELIYEQLTKTE